MNWNIILKKLFKMQHTERKKTKQKREVIRYGEQSELAGPIDIYWEFQKEQQNRELAMFKGTITSI